MKQAIILGNIITMDEKNIKEAITREQSLRAP